MSQGSAQDADPRVGTVLKDNYRIERLLGRGGMGAVYQATHLRLGSQVAVKLLLGEHAKVPEVVQRFRREAKVAMDLSDENIVHIHDYDVAEDGSPFIVMEYLQGEDLEGLIEREAPLPLERAVEIARQVGSALAAAHRLEVVHRDLKPANIFLKRRASGEDLVKVVDFGIAKVADSSSLVTRANALMGTPSYMSPEQANQEQEQIDGRTDIFALGCILYEMLSGQQPFRGDSYTKVLLQVVSQDPPPLRELVPQLAPEVEQVVNRALIKEREERYQDIQQMMVALLSTVGDEWGAAEVASDTVVTFSAAEDLGAPAEAPAEPADSTAFAETLPPSSSPRSPPPGASASDGSGRRGLLMAAALLLLLASGGVIAYQALGPSGAVSGRAAEARPAVAAKPPATPAAAPAPVNAVLDASPDRPRPDVRPPDHAAPAARPTPRPTTLRIIARVRRLPVRAEAFIDGQKAGQTPLTRKIRPGKHMVRLKLRGRAPVDRQVRVRKGQRKTLRVDLD